MNSVTDGNKKTNFTNIEIKDFSGTCELNVGAHVNQYPSCGKLVQLIQDGGSMRFQFSMKPEQAREMAAALFAAAEFLDCAA